MEVGLDGNGVGVRDEGVSVGDMVCVCVCVLRVCIVAVHESRVHEYIQPVSRNHLPCHGHLTPSWQLVFGRIYSRYAKAFSSGP